MPAQPPVPGDIWIAELGLRLKTRPVVVHGVPDDPDEPVIALMCSTSARDGVAVRAGGSTGLRQDGRVVVDDPIRVGRAKLVRPTGYLPRYDSDVAPLVVAAPRDYDERERYGPSLAFSRRSARPSRLRKVGPGPSSPTAQGPASHSPLYDPALAVKYTSVPEVVPMPKSSASPINDRKIPKSAVKKAEVALRSAAHAGHWRDISETHLDTNCPEGYRAVKAGYRHRLVCIEAALAPERYRAMAVAGYVPLEFFSFEDWKGVRDRYEKTTPDLTKGLNDPDEAAARLVAWVGTETTVAPETAAPEAPEVEDPLQGYAAEDLMMTTSYAELCSIRRQEVYTLLDDEVLTEGPRVPRSLIGGGPGGPPVRTVVVDEKADAHVASLALEAPDDDRPQIERVNTRRDQLPEGASIVSRPCRPHESPEAAELASIWDSTVLEDMVEEYGEGPARAALAAFQRSYETVCRTGTSTSKLVAKIRRFVLDVDDLASAEALLAFYHASAQGNERATRRLVERACNAVRAEARRHFSDAPEDEDPAESEDPADLFYEAAQLDYQVAVNSRRRAQLTREIGEAVADPDEVAAVEAEVEAAAAAHREADTLRTSASAEIARLEREAGRIAEELAQARQAHTLATKGLTETQRVLEAARLAAAEVEGPDTRALESEEQTLAIAVRDLKRRAQELRDRAHSLVLSD